MSELVQLTKIDGIEVVTINNPPVNALSSAVASGIAVAVAQIGYGFPAYRGGPMLYADTIGLKNIYERIRGFKQRLGSWWEPPPLLQHLAGLPKTFAEYGSRQGAAT